MHRSRRRREEVGGEDIPTVGPSYREQKCVVPFWLKPFPSNGALLTRVVEGFLGWHPD